MPPTRTAASRKAISTKQASISNYFTNKSSAAPNRSRQRGTEPYQREEKEPPVAETVFPTYPLVKGYLSASFEPEYTEWDSNYHKHIGTRTSQITFCSPFVVTDKHLNQIAALSPKNLRIFYVDNDLNVYDQRNCAKGVTNAGIMRFAAACPNLQNFDLPGADGRWLTDAALIFLLEHCSKLSWVNFMHTGSDGSVFDALLQRADLAPNLVCLFLAHIAEVDPQARKAMKSMRKLSRARPKLLILLLEPVRKKRRGKWETDVKSHVYVNGTHDLSFWDPDEWYNKYRS